MNRTFARCWIGANLTLCGVLAVSWWWLHRGARVPSLDPAGAAIAPVSPPAPRAGASSETGNVPRASEPPAQLPPVADPDSDFLRYASQIRRKARVDAVGPLLEDLKRSHRGTAVAPVLPAAPRRRLGYEDFPELEQDPEFGAEYRRLKGILTMATTQLSTLAEAQGRTGDDPAARLRSEYVQAMKEFMVAPKDSPERAALDIKRRQLQAASLNTLFVGVLEERLSYAPSPLTAEQRKSLFELARVLEPPGFPAPSAGGTGKWFQSPTSVWQRQVSDEFVDRVAAVLPADQTAALRELKSEQDAIARRRELPAESALPGPPGT